MLMPSCMYTAARRGFRRSDDVPWEGKPYARTGGGNPRWPESSHWGKHCL